MGVFSDYTTLTQEIAGLTAAPSDVSGLALQAMTTALLTWDASPDLDVTIGGHIRIRHSSKTSGAAWSDGVSMGNLPGNATSAMLALLQGTYMAKWSDSSGSESSNAVSVVTTAPNVIQLNAVASSVQEPSFPGTHSNTFVDDSGHLELTGTSLIDAELTLMDTWGKVDTLGGVASSGTYTFDNYVDLGAVYTSRITAALQSIVIATDDTIDDRVKLIDVWTNFDGTDNTEASAQLQVRITNDDPASAPTWSGWTPFTFGDYSARALDFRLVLTSTATNRNIEVSVLSVAIDMPDRVDAANSVAIPAAGQVVLFANAFKDTPAIGITAEDMSTGDYVALSAKSRTGFTLKIKNSSGTGVARTADWIAKGYGKAV